MELYQKDCVQMTLGEKGTIEKVVKKDILSHDVKLTPRFSFFNDRFPHRLLRIVLLCKDLSNPSSSDLNPTIRDDFFRVLCILLFPPSSSLCHLL